MIRRLLMLAWLLSVPYFLLSQPAAEMERVVRAALQVEGMQHATLCVSVYDAASGQRLYGHDDQRAVVPASLQKLLTTGTGFARLGDSFRFATRLLMHGEVDRDGVLHGDLYIVGGGDPLLGSYRYRQTTSDTLFALWTAALRSRGVQRIDGRIHYVSSVFSGPQQHDSWQHGDVGNYYGAGATGLNFHENMYFVHFNGGTRQGDPATVARTNPKNITLHALNEVTTGPAGSGDQVVVYGLPQFTERVYSGTVPLGASDFAVRAALPNPARSCADLLATYLRSHGISVSLGAQEALVPPDSVRTVSEYLSPSYKTIAQYTNHTSNNVYAEAIFKYLGYKSSGSGSFASGAKAVEDYLKEKGLPLDGVSVVDGSGLSRLNSVTADFLGRYLSMLRNEPFYEAFFSTLRTADNPAVHYKSGTMQGVRSQAGYIRQGGRTLAYAVVLNGHTASASVAGAEIDRIVKAIIKNF